MKKINVTCICAEAEEYPGCADLLYSYCEVNVVALQTSLVGAETAKALTQSDVLLVDESVLLHEGLQSVRTLHICFPRLIILLVYKKTIKYNIMECISSGVRGLLEYKSRISLLRRAIPALYAGEVWMPRGMVKSLGNQSNINGGSSSWDLVSSMMSDRGRIN